MYKDIINYRLAENITQEHLIKVASRIVNEWMKNQTGFIKWEIHKDNNGGFTDIVYWKSEKDEAAELKMANIPNAMEWYVCYKEDTITSKKLHSIAEF
jgi:hypothetical protein